MVVLKVVDQVQQKTDSVLTLLTGGTPIGMYEFLVNASRSGVVDFGNISTRNLDEYWPIIEGHPASYAHYMALNFFNHVNVAPENIHIPNGGAEDLEVEIKRYGDLMLNTTVDLAVVSIGPGETCHVAFNERGSEVDSRVRYVELDEQTRQANKPYFNNPDDMPSGAITQGIADILRAERILFIATGYLKAWGVHRSLTGEIGPDAPASFLRLHPNVTAILDQEAASLLRL